MTESYSKLQPGQKIRSIPAAQWNAWTDAAISYQHRRPRLGVDYFPHHDQPCVVNVKNIAGEDCPRFGVLGLEAPVILPSENQAEFLSSDLALTGTTPDHNQHFGRIAIMQEPTSNGQIGRGYVSGVCPAKVDIVDEAHWTAAMLDANVDHLQSGPLGSAQILWKEEGTGLKWAVVRLGRPQGWCFARLGSALSGGAGNFSTSDVYTLNADADAWIDTGFNADIFSSPLMGTGDQLASGIFVSAFHDGKRWFLHNAACKPTV